MSFIRDSKPSIQNQFAQKLLDKVEKEQQPLNKELLLTVFRDYFKNPKFHSVGYSIEDSEKFEAIYQCFLSTDQTNKEKILSLLSRDNWPEYSIHHSFNEQVSFSLIMKEYIPKLLLENNEIEAFKSLSTIPALFDKNQIGKKLQDFESGKIEPTKIDDHLEEKEYHLSLKKAKITSIFRINNFTLFSQTDPIHKQESETALVSYLSRPAQKSLPPACLEISKEKNDKNQKDYSSRTLG